jgi:hypothetical protein
VHQDGVCAGEHIERVQGVDAEVVDLGDLVMTVQLPNDDSAAVVGEQVLTALELPGVDPPVEVHHPEREPVDEVTAPAAVFNVPEVSRSRSS